MAQRHEVSEPDEDIMSDVELALSSLLLTALNVTVKNGTVALEGAAATDADAAEAEQLTRRVPGVKDVINNLVVETPEVSLETLNLEQSEIVGEEDAMDAVGKGRPYFPPTDPVVWPSSTSEEGLEIRGGFAPDSLDEAFEPHSHETLQHGDDEITDEVVRALKLDAATADLSIEVETVDGVVYLRGLVGSLDEVEEVEAVAERVPGVAEVIEELEVE